MDGDRERLLESMQGLSDSLSRLVAALELLEARVARLQSPPLRVVRGEGLRQRARFSPATMTFVAGNGSGAS